MSRLPEPLAALVGALGKLPGIGPRTAERLGLHLVQSEVETVRQLARLLTECLDRVTLCQTCGGLTEAQPCELCSQANRDDSLLCLVERPTDILSLEKAGVFRGRYHVLGGRISPLDGVGPEDLRIAELESRLESEPIAEVILALGTDVEGDATSYYLANRFASRGIRISRLAHGLPAGSGLEFADEVTLTHALEGRRDIQ